MPDTLDNSHGLIPVSGRQLAAVGASADHLPALFLRSEHAGKRFWEFFTANIRNRNTRRAYFIAVSRFSAWCEEHRLELGSVEPIHVAAYPMSPISARSRRPMSVLVSMLASRAPISSAD